MKILFYIRCIYIAAISGFMSEIKLVFSYWAQLQVIPPIKDYPLISDYHPLIGDYHPLIRNYGRHTKFCLPYGTTLWLAAAGLSHWFASHQVPLSLVNYWPTTKFCLPLGTTLFRQLLTSNKGEPLIRDHPLIDDSTRLPTTSIP